MKKEKYEPQKLCKQKDNREKLYKKVDTYAKENLKETGWVSVVKKDYLTQNKEQITSAVNAGIHYHIVAKIATEDMMETRELPRSFNWVDKEGKTHTSEPKITPAGIKSLCEA